MTQGKYWMKNYPIDSGFLPPYMPLGIYRGDMTFIHNSTATPFRIICRAEGASAFGV